MSRIKEINVVTINGLDDCQIELAQKIEKDIDEAMLGNGFCRVASDKSGDSLEFIYRQFAKCGVSNG
jgi:hypothetical protein